MDVTKSDFLQEFIGVLKDAIKQEVQAQQPDEFLTEEEASIRYRHSVRKLQMWRSSGQLIQGIHFQKVDGSIRYIPEMMKDRFLNWDDDTAHTRAIQNWRSQQLSAQRKKR